ncbi:MAG: winged helix-turn-helix transcriptional regulator [Asgard group archaeon]|nr:winged helix-turn-helix transcriptional regulator [Asgard group archaeon]
MSNSSKSLILKAYEDAIMDPIKYGIITSLSWYGKLNLTKISKHINKHESTTFRYIKKLIDEGIIEIDIEKTTSEWGKYYKLTDEVQKIYDKKIAEVENFGELIISNKEFRNKSEDEFQAYYINELLHKNLEEDKQEVLNYLSLQQNIQTTIMNEFLTKRQLFKEFYESNKENLRIEDIYLEPCDFIMLANTIRMSKFKHLFRIYEVVYKFNNEIKKLVSEFEKEMDLENVPENKRFTHVLQLFSSNTDFLYSTKILEK